MLALAVVAAALVGAVPAQADDPPDATVCNEAESSFRGGYYLTDGPVDPAPPAFNWESPMAIGSGEGVDDAAEQSPALRACAAEVVLPS